MILNTSRGNSFSPRISNSPRDKKRRVGQLSVGGGSVALRGGEWPRGTLSKNSLAHTVRPSVRPSVLPKRKCREATTGNGGSDGGRSGSTEVSICSLGLVICVLDITARDLRCVSAISRTRARVSSPARRPSVSPSLLFARSVASAIFTYERNRFPLPRRLRPGSEERPREPIGTQRSCGNRRGKELAQNSIYFFARGPAARAILPIDKSRMDDGRGPGRSWDSGKCVRVR